jgi:hypothetical protein
LPYGIRHAIGAVFAVCTGIATPLFPVAAAELSPNETARVLAGLHPLPSILGQSAQATFQTHTRECSKRWDEYERRIGKPIRGWARTELEDTPGETVFYPFSGPDFPTVHQLYPDAGRYVLVAIQRAGPPPALNRYSTQELGAYLTMFRRAWEQFSWLGFFRTNDLDTDAGKAGVRVGVTAPLMAFAVRLGYEIAAVDPVQVNAEGTDLEPHPGRRADDNTWESVRLRLAKNGREVLLDYVRVDISDRNLERNRASGAWIERMAGNRIVLKAASHLLQRPNYSILRNAVLSKAPSIWQDETGIEYAKLADAFTVTLYGRFTRSHPRFSPVSQSTLASAYKASTNVRPLPFVVGYQKESGSSVQVAVRSKTAIGAVRAEGVRSTTQVRGRAPDREIQNLQSRVAAQLAEYARRPRTLFLGGSPVEPVHAEYVASVKSRIARLLLAAGVAPGRGAVLSLTLASDGSLRATDLERSSGSPAFDRRVRALVEQGGPFPHWPDAMRERADLLVITLHLPET